MREKDQLRVEESLRKMMEEDKARESIYLEYSTNKSTFDGEQRDNSSLGAGSSVSKEQKNVQSETSVGATRHDSALPLQPRDGKTEEISPGGRQNTENEHKKIQSSEVPYNY